jgi:WD40 repeat protein/DNA-binding SARP family transcriptional activator/energy-coupling factor transporter ATP-binding protein EcfA2
MEIRLLGPVEVTVEDHQVALGGTKQRAVLAMLALQANTTVSAERLIDGLWEDPQPPSAPKMVQNYVWRLRKLLGEDGAIEIRTHGRGYELRVDPEAVDVARLERLLEEARSNSLQTAREALALFRGEPLADIAAQPFAGVEVRRLQDLRETAVELALDADLEAGRHRVVAARTEALVTENPLNEGLHARRMLALYRCGRQAEALDAYREARTTLVEQVGLEPSPELRRLHDAILRQDPALDPRPAVPELPAALDPATAPPVIGRAAELTRLREHWAHAQSGEGAFVALTGSYGMGKTRLAAELAVTVHATGSTVIYAAGPGQTEHALAAIARAIDAQEPTLLVIDDADRAPQAVHDALRELARTVATAPVLALVTGLEVVALARLGPSDSLALAPLDDQAVEAIVRGYSADIATDAQLAGARGVPRRIHEAAGELARRVALRRVDAAAGRAASGRSEARASQSDLADSVVDLQSAEDRAARALAESGGRVVCPYKGLASYDVEDAEYFFGREQLVAELVARLVGAPLLGVVGPSGSGKSSLVRAGLLHSVADGVLPGSERWWRALIRPGRRPLAELERVLRDGRGLLVVDQFEEIFTSCAEDHERVLFIERLLASTADGTVVVVIAIRADFYGRCAAHPALSRLLGANHVLVGTMSREELARAIERPAQRAGLTVEPDLLDALRRDVEGQPGALPLLSTALLDLWRQREGRRLRLGTYVRSGGVQAAVARLAEDAFLELEPERQATARNVLMRLAGEGEAGQIVRRRLPVSELPPDGSVEVAAQLAERRLLTIDDGAVEVAHEALLSEWPRLRGWLDEDVQGRRLHRQVGGAAAAWDAEGRDPASLPRGARLSAALDWRAQHEDQLNAVERAFLDAGRAAASRAHRRLQLVLAGFAALTLFAIIGGIVALSERGNAETQARAAEAQRLGAQALSEPALDRSLLLARQAVALDNSPATRDTLFSALLREPAAIGVMRGGGRMLAVTTSADGQRLVAGDNRGRLAVFDPDTHRLISTSFDAVQPIRFVRFSPDGSRLVVASGDGKSGAVDVLDGRTFRRLAHTKLPGLGPEAIGSVTFAPDGATFTVTYVPFYGFDPAPDGVLRRFDARSGAPRGPRVPLPRMGAPFAAPLTGGRLLTISETTHETVIRDAASLRPLQRFAVHGPPWASAISRDERLVALGGEDGSLRLLDLRSGRSWLTPGRHGGSVESVAFAPGDRSVVTGGDDGTVIVHPVTPRGPSETFERHSGRVSAIAWSADGRTIFSASLDGTIIAWDGTGSRRLGRVFGARGAVGAQLLSESLRATDDVGYNFGAAPGGDLIAIPRPHAVVDLIDAHTLRRLGKVRMAGFDGGVGVDIAPDGRTMATTSGNGQLQLWDARRRVPLGPPLERQPRELRVGPQPAWWWSPTFSGDSRLLATTGTDAYIRIWDVRAHRQIASKLIAEHLLPRDIGMRPDGRAVAVPLENGPRSGRVAVFAVPSLRTIANIPMRWGRWARFSPDGRLLVLGNHEGVVQLYDGHTFKPRGRPLLGHSGYILTADFSPDGRTLATSSADGTVRLWDVASGQPIGTPLPGLPATEVGTNFVLGGTQLAAVYDGGRGYLWDLRPSSWAQRACAVASRTLTHLEWDETLPDRAFAPACR